MAQKHSPRVRSTSAVLSENANAKTMAYKKRYMDPLATKSEPGPAGAFARLFITVASF